MKKNMSLCALVALFALVNGAIHADGDWFEGLRQPEDRVVEDQGAVGVIFEKGETADGDEVLRVKPVEGALDTIGGIFGGGRSNDGGEYRRARRNRSNDYYR
jgi:hypothetical protein